MKVVAVFRSILLIQTRHILLFLKRKTTKGMFIIVF